MVHIPGAIQQVHKLPSLDLLLGLIDAEIFKVSVVLVIAIVDLVDLVDVGSAPGLQLVELVGQSFEMVYCRVRSLKPCIP